MQDPWGRRYKRMWSDNQLWRKATGRYTYSCLLQHPKWCNSQSWFNFKEGCVGARFTRHILWSIMGLKLTRYYLVSFVLIYLCLVTCVQVFEWTGRLSWCCVYFLWFISVWLLVCECLNELEDLLFDLSMFCYLSAQVFEWIRRLNYYVRCWKRWFLMTNLLGKLVYVPVLYTGGRDKNYNITFQ